MKIKIVLFVVCLAIAAKETALEKQKIISKGFFHLIVDRLKRQTSFKDETTFFDQNSESISLKGRSRTNFPLKTVLDGAPRQPQDIRLRGNKRTAVYEGRVEFYNSTAKLWGPVCNDHWNLHNANVLCEQLGFSKSVRRDPKEFYGRGNWSKNGNQILHIRCTGTEKNIMDCSHEVNSNCSGKLAEVHCLSHKKCPEKWIQVNGACFKVFTEQMEYKQAATFCQDQNFELASILTTKENNFLSNILYSKYQDISQIWTGGYYAEVIQENEKREFQWNWYSITDNMNQWNMSNLWFPGYNISQSDARPQGNLKRRSCVAMSRIFSDSQRLNQSFDVDYFWWDNLSCKEKLPFICQMSIPRPRSDCYENNGVDYRGRISRTLRGTSCVQWTHPSAPINPQSHTGMGLGNHNFCRNPDGDIMPWCWTKPEISIFGYCAVDKCSELSVSVASLKEIISDTPGFGLGGCQSDLFYCPSMTSYNRQCISKKYVCDRILNCIRKEDENPHFCKSHLCKESEFLCEVDMSCISKSQICDSNFNCHDGADEKNCSRIGLELEPILQNQGRIVGGLVTQYGHIPWQVGIRQLEENSENHWCGASILNEEWVISAAHCFGLPEGRYRVRTGDWNNVVLDKHEQVFEIQELNLHPQFNSSTFDYDLALIKIKRKNGEGIKFNDYVKPVPLPKLGEVPDPNSKCMISGWGDTLNNYPDRLLYAQIPLLNRNRCLEFYQEHLTERMLCAGFEEGKIDTCQGDSGGPLACKVNKVYKIFGATSWGNGCGLPKKSGVYAYIQTMLGWIKEKTGLS